MGCDGDQLEEWQFCPVNKSHESIKISSPLVCPFNGNMVSSSSLALMSSKTRLMKTHKLCYIHHISRLVKLKGKHSHASISFFSCSSTSTAIPSHRLVAVLRENCTSLMAFTVSVLFFKSSKRLSAASRKASFTISPSLK